MYDARGGEDRFRFAVELVAVACTKWGVSLKVME